MIKARMRLIFYHLGITSFDPEENAFRHRLYPDIEKWERGIFTDKGLQAPYYVSRAKNQKALIVGGTGLKAQYLLNPAEVQRLNDEGISVIWMALPEMSGTAPFMGKFKLLFKKFLTDSQSPAFRLFPEDITRLIGVHSTAGLLLAELLHEDETRRKLSGYSGVVYNAIFLDTANSSRDHSSRFNQIAFNFYAAINLDKKPHDTLAAKIYLCIKASTESFTKRSKMEPFIPQSDDTSQRSWIRVVKQKIQKSRIGQIWTILIARAPDVSPTYRHILEVQSTGRDLIDIFNPVAMNSIPSIFLVGDKDAFACPKTTLALTEKMNAAVTVVEAGKKPSEPSKIVEGANRKAEVILVKGGGHDPVHGNPVILDMLVNRVHACVALRQEYRLRTAYIPYSPPPREEIDIPSYTAMDALRYRAGLALKSGTRFLYSAASFF